MFGFVSGALSTVKSAAGNLVQTASAVPKTIFSTAVTASQKISAVPKAITSAGSKVVTSAGQKVISTGQSVTSAVKTQAGSVVASVQSVKVALPTVPGVPIPKISLSDIAGGVKAAAPNLQSIAEKIPASTVPIPIPGVLPGIPTPSLSGVKEGIQSISLPDLKIAPPSLSDVSATIRSLPNVSGSILPMPGVSAVPKLAGIVDRVRSDPPSLPSLPSLPKVNPSGLMDSVHARMDRSMDQGLEAMRSGDTSERLAGFGRVAATATGYAILPVELGQVINMHLTGRGDEVTGMQYGMAVLDAVFIAAAIPTGGLSLVARGAIRGGALGLKAGAKTGLKTGVKTGITGGLTGAGRGIKIGAKTGFGTATPQGFRAAVKGYGGRLAKIGGSGAALGFGMAGATAVLTALDGGEDLHPSDDGGGRVQVWDQDDLFSLVEYPVPVYYEEPIPVEYPIPYYVEEPIPVEYPVPVEYPIYGTGGSLIADPGGYGGSETLRSYYPGASPVASPESSGISPGVMIAVAAVGILAVGYLLWPKVVR